MSSSLPKVKNNKGKKKHTHNYKHGVVSQNSKSTTSRPKAKNITIRKIKTKISKKLQRPKTQHLSEDEEETTKMQSEINSVCSERTLQEVQILDEDINFTGCVTPNKGRFLCFSEEESDLTLCKDQCKNYHLNFQEAQKSFTQDQEYLEFDKFLYDNEELRHLDFDNDSMISEINDFDSSKFEEGDYDYNHFFI